MTSSHRCFAITLLLLSLEAMLPATVGAQPPVYLAQWGIPGSGNGEFNKPYRVAVDAAGDVYVVDFERESLGGNSRIQKFTSSDSYITQWGSYGSGNGLFDNPYYVATDAAGNVYVSELANQRIQKFTGDGTFLTQWGSFGTGSGEFNCPYGIAVNAVGEIFVADFDNYRVQKFGQVSTPTKRATWGRIKSLYR